MKTQNTILKKSDCDKIKLRSPMKNETRFNDCGVKKQ